MIESRPNNNDTLDRDVVIPIKYFNNIWRFFASSLINCEAELDFFWSKKFIISKIRRKPAVPGNPDGNSRVPNMTAIQANGAAF